MHFATVAEAIAGVIPDSPAIRQGDRVVTWGDYEERGARFAAAIGAHGLGHASKVGLYLRNTPEYLEASLGAYKARAMPVNINYRYVGNELAYLLENSDAEALVFGDSLRDVVASLERDRLPDLLVQVSESADDVALLDGAVAYEDLLAAHRPAPPIERDDADHHILYTGGTTGLPKGVLYEFGPLMRELARMVTPVAAGTTAETIEDLVAMAKTAAADGTSLVTAVFPPLMHGTGMALAFMAHLVGGSVSLLEGAGFDAEEALDVIERDRARVVNVVGDAFARPLVAAIEARDPAPDLSSVSVFLSSGAMFSAPVKEAVLGHVPQAMVLDTLAASEGAMGTSVTMAGMPTTTAAFSARDGVTVFDEDDRPVEPGSGVVGVVGVRSTNPVGYHKDPEKTARTFRVIDGVRYSFPGDHGLIEADGSLTLLGRGSHCINTGGEKVYPEEVEEALKSHPAVTDALVVGVDDERWGQRIGAVVSLSADIDDAELIAHVKTGLAGYKAPKSICRVDTVPRAPNGKADYAAARALLSAGSPT